MKKNFNANKDDQQRLGAETGQDGCAQASRQGKSRSQKES
jgi:hypothetical protein